MKDSVPANTIAVGQYYCGYGSGITVVKVPEWGEFVLAEKTQTFDKPDVSYFFPLMLQSEQRLGFRPRFGTFDAAFDAFYVYDYFHRPDDPDAFAAVPFSEKGGYKTRQFSPDGSPICAAGLAMPLQFTYTDRTLTIINYGITSNTKVDIYVELRNGKEQGLGLPLPAGRVRVYKMDEADGSLEFIGEDGIDHTPKDETVRLKLGSAFDVVAERKQTDFRMDERAHWIRESFEIRVRNHKEEAVEVIVKENLYRWANWTIEQKTHDFTKEDARTAHFPLSVPKDGETVLTYTVLYTW